MTTSKLTLAAALFISSTTAAFADMNSMIANADQQLSAYTLGCSHWYVGGNLGVSHLKDSATTGTNNSVTQNGPGWSVNGGYQFNTLLGTELGFTQYHDSRETSGATNVAKTEHYAVDLVATGRYPIINRWSVIGKLGAAYAYANKIYTAGGGAASSGSLSPYGGVGFAYAITPKIDFIAQWAAARGNEYTGSSSLYSLGLNAALVA
jgi:hypothetical protein